MVDILELKVVAKQPKFGLKKLDVMNNLHHSIHGYPMLACFGNVVLNHMLHTLSWPDHIKKK